MPNPVSYLFNCRNLLPALLLLSLLCCGCRGGREQAEAGARRYELKGRVVAVDKASGRVTVAHEEVKGYMDAMTMPFSLKDDWPLGVLAPGDEITATLVVGRSSSWLEDVVIAQQGVKTGEAPGQSAGLPQPGDAVPDYGLINQDGKRIHLGQYRGKALLLTFVYTRCPLPEYCELMSDNFAQIDKELAKTPALYAKTHLLTVSFDPAHDTPKVLRSYGAAHTGRFSDETFEHWEFATGNEEEVKSIAQFFGLRYDQQTDQIIHTLSTAIVTPDGKIYKIYTDNRWKPEDVMRDLQSVVGEKHEKS